MRRKLMGVVLLLLGWSATGAWGLTALDVVDDALDDCYVVTAYNVADPAVEYWELKVDQLSGCLYSFKDLTDSGDGFGDHTNYMGASGYNRQCSLLYMAGRDGRVLNRKLALTDLADRLSFTAAQDGSSFTITYAEDAQSTDFFHSTYGTVLNPGDLLATITLVIRPPTAAGTVWDWSIECENVSGAALTSKIWAQQYTCSAMEDDVPKTLDSELTRIDGAWNPATPQSFMRWTIDSNALGLTEGLEFIIDYQDGMNGESLGGTLGSGVWAGFDYCTYSAPCSYTGTDLANGETRIDAGQMLIGIAETPVNAPPVADAGSDQTLVDYDLDGYETVTLDASASSDSDGTIVSYAWSEGGSPVASGASPSVSLAVGAHTLLLTVTDDDSDSDSDEVVITVAAAESHGSQMQTQSSYDDAYATTATCEPLTSTFYWPYRNLDRIPFVRFECDIPPGATITSAVLKVHATGSAGDANPTTLRLGLLDYDDCPTFTYSDNPYADATTIDYVDWTLPGVWAADTWYSSPDISTLVQGFIDRANYEVGKHLGIRGLWQTGSYKMAHTWDYDDHTYGPVLEVTYTGGVAPIELLMADPEVRIGQKIYCRATNINSSDTLVATLDSEVVFSKAGSQVGAEEMFTTDYSSFTAGTHSLCVQVIAADLSVRGEKTRTWTTLHDGVPHVGINIDNAMCVDGTPFLPISSWILASARFDDPLSTTINTLLGIGWYPEYNLANWDDYLDRGQTAGWYVSGPLSWPGKVSSNLATSDMSTVASYVAATKSHPALLTWFWHDEPDLYADNAPGMRLLHETTHLYDTDHPTRTNLVGYRLTHDDQPWSNQRAQEYCYMYNDGIFGEKTMVADVLGMDYYPHEYSTYHSFCNISDYLLAVDRLRQWNYDLVPTATFIQPCDEAGPDHPRLYDRDWSPPPTEAMVKNLIWLSLIHEVKVLSYFHYFEWFTTTPRPNLSPMQEALTWITDLTQVILSSPDNVTTDVSVTVPSGYRVDFLPREYDGDLYIFSGEVRDWGDPVYYQPDPDDITTAYFNIPAGVFTARFDVDGLPDDTTITVYGESRTITSEAGYFEDDFDAQDVHIYIIEGPPAQQALAAIPGDADGDGHVNVADFVILKRNYGMKHAFSAAEGDFNGDGVVDVGDFIILKQNYGI